MKLFIIIIAVTLTQAAKLDRTYLPPNAQQSSGSAFLQTPRESRFQAQPTAYSADAFAQNNGNINGYNNFARQERPQAAYDRNAAILRQDNENDGERYAYAYETENGIYAEENGVATNGMQAQGGFTYTGDDGKVYSIRYTADENGFLPQGDHLPTPPPVPEEILKSLEQNARDEAAGIYDDGSYNEAKDNGIAQQYYNSNAQPINYNAPITAQDAIITNAAISRTSANARALALETPEKAYLPPFAQRISNAQDTAIFRTSGSGRALVSAPQKAYLPPSAQRVTSNVDDAVVTNAAISRTSANAHSFPVGAPQKEYLPPTQRIANQRTAASARQFSFNAREGYRY